MADINKAWQWAVNTCNAPNVGYSQKYRNQQTVNGITYYDCSSFIFYALINGGFELSGYPFVTWTMPDALEALGFTHFDPKTTVWKAGDILIDTARAYSLQHTEMVYLPSDGVGSGYTMGAHQSGVALADQVSINNYITTPTSYWNHYNDLYRLGDGGDGEGYGISKTVISAILGNWLQESGINPGIYEGLREVDLFDKRVYGGYGLGQWTNTVDAQGNPKTSRRTALAEWLRDNGYEMDSGTGQLEFLLYEKAWIPKQPWSTDFPDFDSFINSKSSNLEYLTVAFYNCWEGGGSGTAPERYANAQKIYKYLTEHGGDTGLEWIKGNRYLSEGESMNNAVLVYQYLSAGGGGGGGDYSRKGMPVWMMINYTNKFLI